MRNKKKETKEACNSIATHWTGDKHLANINIYVEFLLTTRAQSCVKEDVIAFKHFHLLENDKTQKNFGFATMDHLEYRIPMCDGYMNFYEHTQEDSPLTHTFFI